MSGCHQPDTSGSVVTSGKGEMRRTVPLLGVEIDVVDTAALCYRLLEFAAGNRQRRVMYVNADCMLIAHENRRYGDLLNRADLVYADGIGVVLGARLFGHRLPGRSTGADFFPYFCAMAAERGIRLYLLGAAEGVARAAAERLQRDIPELRIVGTHHGYFRRRESGRIIDAVNRARPHVVVIGFGAPAQEFWMEEFGPRLEARVLWGVGGLFDFLSGNTRRGPRWLLDHGFEWLCRLFIEPRRLWRRYLIGNVRFLALLLRHRLFNRKSAT